MKKLFLKPKINIFDTTMRDGELTPGVKMDIHQKVSLAYLLEEMRVDVIEVGYPGAFKKDFDEIFTISTLIKESTICGLASSDYDEIISVAQAIKPAAKGRIHVYTPVNIKDKPGLDEKQIIVSIKESVALARKYCSDVEWSAFDAPRSNANFLCRSIEAAIKSGATTINIPDSLGLSSPEEFSTLVKKVINHVPNIDQATVSVHCHNDRGWAVDNSIAALSCGARQIECSINGLGARKGNADLANIVMALSNHKDYQVCLESFLLKAASEMVSEITKKRHNEEM